MAEREGGGTPGAMISPRTWIALAVCLAATAYFYANFVESRFQPLVDAAWPLSLAAWLFAFWRADTASAPRLAQPYWFYALYAVSLLPYCTNWRWAMTGDTLGWLFMGIAAHDDGISKSVWSARGPDQFGYTQMLLHNLFMLLVDPTIFWHRVGKILVAVAAAAAIYTAFARMLRPAFALLVTACTAACSVWIVYVHSPFPYYDGVAGAFSLLAVALWVRRDPSSQRAWLVLGTVSGLMLFATMNGWFMALCVWLWLAALVAARRLPLSLFVLAGVTGVIAGGPMLYQWLLGDGGAQFDLVQRPAWTVEKVTRFFLEAVKMPFASQLYSNGAFGPQLPWGFRWLFVLGIAVTPWLPSRFPKSRFLLGLYVVHLIGLVFTQGPYESVSPKRALILIPMATYFAFLPFQQWIRSTWAALPIIAVWATLGVSDVVARVQPGIVGYTLLDGVIEAHQRFAEVERICVYLPGDERGRQLAAGSHLDRLYDLATHVAVATDVSDPACAEVLCWCSQEQCQKPDPAALGYDDVRLLNSNELRCARRPAG